jgi:hypothetical protein
MFVLRENLLVLWRLLLLLERKSSCQALEASAPEEIVDKKPILTPFTPK